MSRRRSLSFQMLKTFINNRKQDKSVSIEEYSQELLDAEAEFERGEYT
ncbi:hypothetical protein [Parapedobacter koreensis]|uniref:Uncharacterized protein n=1 Tax=Parapedobacter koreensis TaxID=332977 RepID=A0A1H7NJR6_9SPHI|nr:hypothetical protein [Parapedobacter koreensis]SEL23569.1 hypothetical protein SAMN05421740_1047 [Parapedobacter koreensis]